VPLREIIAASFGVGIQSKKVNIEYHRLINKVGSEFNILLDNDLSKIPNRIAEGVRNVRAGNIHIDPGYDGIYGKVHIYKDENIKEKNQQTLF
jgi:PHP family Zn ribbon phosphoesterase